MDVNGTTFFYHLPTILKRIGNAHFIAFDLELSGIPELGKRRGNGRPTLQERYDDIKEAAEKYQILQVGLTIVEEDREKDRYLIRPFNINLSPLIDDERYVSVERDFTYSSSAINFLRGQGYDMNSPFSKGVPYLTRQETTMAWERAKLKFDRTSIPDMEISASDTYAIEFLARIKKEIAIWESSSKKNKPEYTEVTGVKGENDKSETLLSRFEKRLVHQTVRSCFPHLDTFSTLNGVKVKAKGAEIVDSDQEPWRRHTASAICLQTGFRWIAEAIAAGNLDTLDPIHCGHHIAGEPETPNRASFRKRIKDLIQACTERPKVLVGHNCFLDIVYLFKLFYGDLPEKVEDFQAAVHTTFPLIFDTKYLVTYGDGFNRFRSSQLWQIDQAFAKQEVPQIEQIDDQPQYAEDDSSFHQAGFDSFVTAKVFLRLAAKFDAQARGEDVRMLGSNPAQHSQFQTSMHTDPQTLQFKVKDEASSRGDENIAPVSSSHKGVESDSMVGDTSSILDDQASNKYASKNPFDSLSDSDMEAAGSLVENPASSSSTVQPAAVESLEDGIKRLNMEDEERLTSAPRAARTSTYVLPAWDAEFWRPYKNRMRVFGTREEVCELQPRTPGPAGRPKQDSDAAETTSLMQKVWQLFL